MVANRESTRLENFFRTLADQIVSQIGPGRRLLAIDGVDGSGKTRFAENLIAQIHDRPTITIHADDFLNPSSLRHAQGRSSARGFWEDTYDYDSLIQHVFSPLSVQGDGWYSSRSYDAQTDEYKLADVTLAPANALIVVEGMFLHRDELVTHWDCSVFLDVPFTETAARMAVRNGSNPDPEHASMHRYVGGQRLYFDAAQPWERATFIVDNTDYSAPKFIQAHAASAVH